MNQQSMLRAPPSQARKAARPPASNSPPSPEMATAPLSRLVDLRSEYQLVTPRDDNIPLTEGQRLVCLGDVHGDVGALTEFLELAGVYSPSKPNKWLGGNTILVQCGDVLDRGSQELQCWKLLAKLSQQAAQEGGAIICLWGNHEG